MGGGGSGCAGGEEGMWAVGVVGTLLWVVNAVKAQNQTEQEGAPPNADPGGSADIHTYMCIDQARAKDQMALGAQAAQLGPQSLCRCQRCRVCSNLQ